MALSDRKRRVGKLQKKTHIAHKTASSPVVTELKNRISCAKTVHHLLRSIYNKQSSLARGNKMEKTRLNLLREETLMKRYLQFCDPVVVFEDEFERLKPVKTSETIEQKIQTKPPHDIPPRPPVRAVPQPPPRRPTLLVNNQFSTFDQEYRSRFRVSALNRPIYDLLPSPAMFTLHIAGVNEGAKFLQEVALEKMDIFSRVNIDKNFPKLAKKKPDEFSRVCAQCETDFSAVFTPIDAKKTKFLCEKCVTKKKRTEAAKLDILSLYNCQNNDRQSNIPKMVAISTAPSKPTVFPRVPSTVINKPMATPQLRESVNVTRPKITAMNPPFPSTIPRLLVRTNAAPRPEIHTNRIVSKPSLIAQDRRITSQPSATQTLYPVFIPLSTISGQTDGLKRAQTTVHYRPQRDIRLPGQTTVLRETPPSTQIRPLANPSPAPGLRLVRLPHVTTVHSISRPQQAQASRPVYPLPFKPR